MITLPPIYSTQPIGAAPPYAAPAQSLETFLLLSPRDSDAATLTAGSQIDSLPVGNMQTVQPRKVWRSTAATDYLLAAFARPVACNALALVAVNLSGAAVVRVRAAATVDLLTTPDLDTGWQSPWPPSGPPIVPDWPNTIGRLRWDNGSAYAVWRVDIADPMPGAPAIEAGRFVLGRAWQPSTNFDFGGNPLAYAPTDVVAETDYGYSFTDRRNASAPRVFSLTLSGTNRREIWDGLGEIQRLAGLAGDVICCLDPGESTDWHLYSMQGRFTQAAQFAAPAEFDNYGYVIGATIALKEFL